MNNIGPVAGKNILFLQGPMGTFFKKIDSSFRKKSATTYKIGFNMGDHFFSYKDNYIPFNKKPEEWPLFIEEFLLQKKIDKVFLFGDCRYYQKITRKIAHKYNIEIFVFEEGYIRPNYITLEKFGVNAFSQLPREVDFYNSITLTSIPKIEHTHPSKAKMIISAIIYYGISNIFHYKYPYYTHHRGFSAIQEAFYGVRGVVRKILYYFTEKDYPSLITKKISKQYYFVPLQTHNDFQILQHSNYQSIEKFIIEVLESFAHHAPKTSYLLFKHHPVDRGRKNYSSFIKEQATLLKIDERVITIHDVHLPDCLKHALGTITINSTVGLSSIGYGIPTLTLGNAIYDIKGLTNKGVSLKNFWHSHTIPNKDLYQKFTQYLIKTTQLNGSFYGRFPKELT